MAHRRWILVAALACGCSERALDHCVPVDAAQPRDLSVPPDLLSDFAHPPEDPCPAGARFIFTIEDSGRLSRWNPVTKLFFPVGVIHCPSNSGTPNSMAIAHDGNGWVNYTSGELFRLDTTLGQCSATPFDPSKNTNFVGWGMSFAQDSPGSKDETLFITDNSSGPAYLGTVDLINYVVASQTTLGNPGHAELTGDNQAQLWGFFPDVALPQVGRIDKMTGAVDMIFSLPSLAGSPQDWAFAAWDGDFYIFLRRNGDPSTNIYKLHSADGSIEVAIAGTGRTILGVGVATCAGNPVADD